MQMLGNDSLIIHMIPGVWTGFRHGVDVALEWGSGHYGRVRGNGGALHQRVCRPCRQQCRDHVKHLRNDTAG